MQGLADGYFILPYTLAHYLASQRLEKVTTDHPAFAIAKAEVNSRVKRLLAGKGERSPRSFHRELGLLLWEHCGMARNKAGLTLALSKIPAIREEFWQNLRLSGDANSFNQQLEHAGRVADYLEFGELMCRDALQREESCGGHFRTEYQTADGEAQRNDEKFSHAAVWEFQGEGKAPLRHQEELTFSAVQLSTRSYK
jgi:succinate dehydrogenase / fumarate reductase flavoprotein subunit